jgi:hypothetical protein
MTSSGQTLPSHTRPADRALWTAVIGQARCAQSSLDADQWFPVSTETQSARREAAAAIALCLACPVRTLCLELSLRQWSIGQYGVWGGLVAPERAALRQLMPASTAGTWPASRPDRRTQPAPGGRQGSAQITRPRGRG